MKKLLYSYLPIFLSITLVLMASLASFYAFAPKVQAACGNGYSYCQQITIDHTQAGASDSSNFTLEASTTQASLATVANGGHIQNTTTMTGGSFTGSVPADFVVTSDAACTTNLNWEFEDYSATTGRMIFWFQVSTLSHTADSNAYVCYGNSSVTTWQGNVNGTWDSMTGAVYHLPNGSTLSAVDSSALARNGTLTNTPTATAGNIDGGGNFVGSSSQWISLPNSNTFVVPTSSSTISVWVNGSSFTSDERVFNFQNSGGTAGIGIGVSRGTAHHAYCHFRDAGNVFATLDNPNVTIDDSKWHLITETITGTTATCYVDGGNSTTASTVSDANSYRWGAAAAGIASQNAGTFYTGKLDEVKYSATVRSADWITAEYNNEKSGSTMVTFGAEQTGNSTVSYGTRIFVPQGARIYVPVGARIDIIK